VGKSRARQRKGQAGGISSLPPTVTSVDEGSASTFDATTVEGSFEYDFLFKFILVGSAAVGKSCLMLRFTESRFKQAHEATIAVDFGSETIVTRRRQRIKVQIWDTAGQEYFQSITNTYFRDAAAAIIVYDVTNRASFDAVPDWLKNIHGVSANSALVITLVANKSDRPVSERQVSVQEGEALARSNGLLFLETSAFSGSNVQEAFVRTAEAVVRKMDQGLVDPDDRSQGVRRGERLGGNGGSIRSAQGRQGSNTAIQLGINANNRLGTEGDDQCYC